MSPVGWKPRNRQQFSAGKTRTCSSRTVTRTCSSRTGAVLTQIGYAPIWLKAQDQTAVQRRQSDSLQQQNSSRAVSSQIQRRQSDSLQQQNSSRAVSSQIGHASVWLEAATTESREVKVSDTSHLTRPTQIQNSLAVAKPAADREVPCRKGEISQQQNGGGAVSTQIGHAPVRLEVQGQTAVQCRQNEISQQQQNSSRAVLTQIGHKPGRLEAQEQTAVQCRQNEICSSSRTVVGHF